MAISRTRNGTIMRRVSGTVARGPCDCDCGYPTCDECPECDPEQEWEGVVSDSAGLAEIIGDGGAWGMQYSVDPEDPIVATCVEGVFGLGGFAWVLCDEFCGVGLRFTIIGTVECENGVYTGYLEVHVEQHRPGELVEWVEIARGETNDLPVTIVGGCDAECKQFVVRGEVTVNYLPESRETLEESYGMEPDELLGCYSSSALFAVADLELSFSEKDCP